jgi:hypothetical protein
MQALLLAAPVAAAAATPPKPNELTLGIGDAGLLFALEDVVVTIGTLGYVTYGDQQGGFQLVGGYQRWLPEWATLGVTGSWAGSRRTMFVGGVDRGDVERRLLTVMADGRAHWFRRPRVSLYSGLAFGLATLSDDLEDLPDEDDLTGAAFHVIPIGIRFGRDVSGFVELGAGWHGFLKAGLTGRM